MIKTVATPVNALVGPATHRHVYVRSRQPHRKMEARLNRSRGRADFASVSRLWGCASARRVRATE